MPFIADNILFIASSVLLAGLIALSGNLQNSAQQNTASSAGTVQQPSAGQTVSPNTAQTTDVTVSAPTNQTTTAPAPTQRVKPSVRGGGEGSEREEYDE